MLDEVFRLAWAVEGGTTEILEPLVDRVSAALDQAVGVEEEHAADGQLDDGLRVLRVRSRAQGQATPALDELDASIGERQERRRMSRPT